MWAGWVAASWNVIVLMLQVMVKTWEWQFVNTMEATMKQVERMQRRNAELKLDLTGEAGGVEDGGDRVGEENRELAGFEEG